MRQTHLLRKITVVRPLGAVAYSAGAITTPGTFVWLSQGVSPSDRSSAPGALVLEMLVKLVLLETLALHLIIQLF